MLEDGLPFLPIFLRQALPLLPCMGANVSCLEFEPGHTGLQLGICHLQPQVLTGTFFSSCCEDSLAFV